MNSTPRCHFLYTLFGVYLFRNIYVKHDQIFERLTLFFFLHMVYSQSRRIVFNDDFNTFEHVTSTLVKVCKHEKNQAEQCTLLIHYKGKCKVKEGSFSFLKPMREGITDAGINAAIV